MSVIYENTNIKIEAEASEIPWLKIFTQHPYKEMNEVSKRNKARNEKKDRYDSYNSEEPEARHVCYAIACPVLIIGFSFFAVDCISSIVAPEAAAADSIIRTLKR